MAIPEHGIPPLKVTDGPNGARGEFFTDGTPVCSVHISSASASRIFILFVKFTYSEMLNDSRLPYSHVVFP